MILTPPFTAARSATVTLTGHSTSEIVIPALVSARSYIWFNRDGTIDYEERVDGRVQIETTTDWMVENRRTATIGDGFQVRYIDTPTNAFDVDAAGGVNTWVTLSADRQFGYERFATGISQSGMITFEIRRTGLATITTGEFSMYAEMQTI